MASTCCSENKIKEILAINMSYIQICHLPFFKRNLKNKTGWQKQFKRSNYFGQVLVAQATNLLLLQAVSFEPITLREAIWALKLHWKRHPNPKRLETNNQCEISLHSSWNITDYCMTHHQNHYRDILGNIGKYGIVRQIPGSGHKIFPQLNSQQNKVPVKSFLNSKLEC